jgi:hypothetical protein
MKHSLLTNFLYGYLGIFIGYIIIKSLIEKELNFVNFLLSVILGLCCFISSLSDRIIHINKLNEVHKQQLLNRRVFDEITKLNYDFNQKFKKDN